MNKKHNIIVLTLLSITICLISIFIVNKDTYFTSFLTIGDVTIISKQTNLDTSSLTLTIDNAYLVDKYDLLKQTKTFIISDQALYDSIVIHSQAEYAGITLKINIPAKILSKDALLRLQKDPFQVLCDDTYSKYISIVAIHN